MTSIPSHIGLRIDNKYLIEAKLGSGGMATVYRAKRLLIGDTVAIKILHPGQVDDRQSVERFRREAEAAARLKHPNVVPIYDFGVASDELVYLVMEFVEGKSIREMLQEHGPFAPKMAAEIITQVCSALEAAHKKNIVHRDIKPDNIVVDTTPGGISVRVLDFGIAWMRDVSTASLTATGNVVGTPHYMSPEQCLGEEPDPRSDIYSVGIVLFEMLTGVVPFNSRVSTAVVIQHVNQAPPSLRAINTSVPPAVEAVVMQALAKQRDQRPRSAALLAAELTAATGGNDVRPNRPSAGDVATTVKMPLPDWSGGRRSSSSQSSKSRRWVWASAGLVVLVGAASVFLSDSREGSTGRPQITIPGDSLAKIGSKNSESATQVARFPEADSVGASNTSQPAPQRAAGIVFPEPGGTAKGATYSVEKQPAAQPPTARGPTASKAEARELGTRETRASASRDSAVIAAAGKKAALTNAPIPSAVPTRAAPPSAPPPSAAPTNAAGTDAISPNLPVNRPNWPALASQAANSCLNALRSSSIEPMARLYSAATVQDKANRAKLLARMSDASSRLAVTGSPGVGPAQIFEDSTYTDLLVRLTWRGNFGQAVNKTATFRATIAQTEGDSHISCRIIGKADL